MPSPIIPDILPLTQAIAVGSQTLYSTTWTANAPSDVVVYSRPANTVADDATQILMPTQYNVAFIGSGEIVQVTLVTPSTTGDIVTITRMTPADRLNLYSNTNFTPSMLNNDFEILTLVDQQAQLVNQQITPRYNYSALIEPVVDTILPILGPNQIWMKNSADNAIVAVDFVNPSSGGGNITLWETITAPSIAVAGGTGIVADRTATPVQVILPAIFNVGDEVAILGAGAGGWSLVAGASQTIKFGSSTTSTAGAINSDIQFANIFIRGLVANTTWTVTQTNSNPTFI